MFDKQDIEYYFNTFDRNTRIDLADTYLMSFKDIQLLRHELRMKLAKIEERKRLGHPVSSYSMSFFCPDAYKTDEENFCDAMDLEDLTKKKYNEALIDFKRLEDNIRESLFMIEIENEYYYYLLFDKYCLGYDVPHIINELEEAKNEDGTPVYTKKLHPTQVRRDIKNALSLVFVPERDRGNTSKIEILTDLKNNGLW